MNTNRRDVFSRLKNLRMFVTRQQEGQQWLQVRSSSTTPSRTPKSHDGSSGMKSSGNGDSVRQTRVRRWCGRTDSWPLENGKQERREVVQPRVDPHPGLPTSGLLANKHHQGNAGNRTRYIYIERQYFLKHK